MPGEYIDEVDSSASRPFSSEASKKARTLDAMQGLLPLILPAKVDGGAALYAAPPAVERVRDEILLRAALAVGKAEEDGLGHARLVPDGDVQFLPALHAPCAPHACRGCSSPPLQCPRALLPATWWTSVVVNAGLHSSRHWHRTLVEAALLDGAHARRHGAHRARSRHEAALDSVALQVCDTHARAVAGPHALHSALEALQALDLERLLTLWQLHCVAHCNGTLQRGACGAHATTAVRSALNEARA